MPKSRRLADVWSKSVSIKVSTIALCTNISGGLGGGGEGEGGTGGGGEGEGGSGVGGGGEGEGGNGGGD